MPFCPVAYGVGDPDDSNIRVIRCVFPEGHEGPHAGCFEWPSCSIAADRSTGRQSA